MSETDVAKKLLRKDPILLGRILLARARVRLQRTPHAPIQCNVGNGVVYEFDFADAALQDSFQYGQPAMKAMLYGSYEPTLQRTLRRFLKPGDTFVDIGANIGYVSALGAGLVGTRGQVHSFEPVPRYFRRLQRLAALNPDYRIHANPCALGDHAGSATITLGAHNIGNNSLIADGESTGETVEVPVRRLGDYLSENHIARPALLKIDVEGWEFPVLKGMDDYFAATTYRPPIVCEVNADAPTSLGYTMAEFSDHMARRSYTAYDLIGTNTRVDLCAITEFANVLFLP